MRKEILLAILFGILFGLVVAFGIWRANSAIRNQKNTPATSISPEVSSESSQTDGLQLTLSEPEDSAVISENPTRISGVTLPNSWVVISDSSHDFVLKSNAQGAFEQQVDLSPGINQVLINSFDEDFNTTEKELTLVYSQGFDQGTNTAEEENGQDSNSVREKVQEKIEKALNKPKAFIGSVTDISGQTLQVKNMLGEIEQISLDKENTTYAKLDKTIQNLTSEDIGIGDFVAALGFSNGNGVLSAKRILVTAPIKDFAYKVVPGKVVNVEKKVINLETSQDAIFTLEFPARWKGPEIKEISSGDQVIAVFSEAEGKKTIRTIEISGSTPSHTP